MQHLLMNFAVFHDIADVAGADPKALRSYNSILCGDRRIGYGQQQVANTGLARLAPGSDTGVVPLLAVGTEDQHKLAFGDKGLMITGINQMCFQGWIGYIDDGIELLIASGRRVDGGEQNGFLLLCRNITIFKCAYGFALDQFANGLIHNGTSLLDKSIFAFARRSVCIVSCRKGCVNVW